jgi:hypothetical protein
VSTVAVSATSDVDYQSHTLDLVTVLAGQTTSSPVSVAVFGDSLAEGDETFQMVMMQPSEVFGYGGNLPPGQTPPPLPLPDNSQIASLADRFATVTILDDDVPMVTVDPGPVVLKKGPGGVTWAVFTIRLSSPNRQTSPVRVMYTLANGTATGGAWGTPGVDFDNTSGFVDFAPGQFAQTVRVAVFGSAAKESNKAFTLSVAPAPGEKVVAGPTPHLTSTATILAMNMTTVSFNAKKPVTYRDVAGNIVTITLSGPGTGTLTRATNGQAQFLSLTGTTGNSVLTIRTNRGQTTFAGIQIIGGLAKLDAPTTNVTGNLTSRDPIRSLNLNSIFGAQVVLGGALNPNVLVTLNVNRIVNSSLDSRTAIQALNLGSWVSTGPTDVLTAPSIRALRATGDFGADIVTTVGDIGTMIIDGRMKGSMVTVTPTPNGQVVGKIGSITVGSMMNSHVTAGLRIGSVVVRNAFSNSTIKAPRIDALDLGRIQNTTGSPLVAAEAGKIGLVRWTFQNKTKQIQNVSQPGIRGLDKNADQNPQIILLID